MTSPFVIALTAADEAVSQDRASAVSRGTEHRDVVRARIVLAAADGATNAAIATEVGVRVDTVAAVASSVRHRVACRADDLPRTGRPRRFTAETVAAVTALACTLPAETGIPLSRW